MRFKLDVYDLRARVAPALIAAFPIGLLPLLLAPNLGPVWTSCGALASFSGLSLLLMRLTRERGKSVEPGLFMLWEGKPTTRQLRHRHASNKIVLARYHRRFGELLPDTPLPSAREELLDPGHADSVYDAAVKFLITRTRGDHQIFQENCSYGFCRNLFALRPIGLVAAAVAAFTFAGAATFRWIQSSTIDPVPVLGAAIAVLGFGVWWRLVNEHLVRRAAEAYAERLLSALDRDDL